MTTERYPADLVVTDQDFADCGWKALLTGITREGYSFMWQAFSAAARQAMEEGRQHHGKVLWLLADACSMRLSPNSVNEPFKPYMVMDDQRSVIPDDLSEQDVLFFSMIMDMVDDLWLKARLAELIWLKQRPRDIRCALTAIDSYRTIPLDMKTWVRGGRECWQRAIVLARMLNGGAGERIKEMEGTIVTAFEAATRTDGFLSLWLADLLETNHLGHEKRLDIAKKIDALAHEIDTDGDLHRAREYFGASARWYNSAGEEAKAAEMTVCVAEGWAKEAVARMSSEQPSHMVAASFYENAIQTYRTIPRTERAVHRVDERMAELRKHLSEAGEKSLDEMGVITSPGVDISLLVENARNAVRGKSSIEALKAFADLHHGARAKELRENAIEQLRNHPLQALFPATVVSRDGRVIAKRPGISLGGVPSDEDEIVIRAEMVHNYGILVGIIVQGNIWPALGILLLEHRLREADFISIASQSPIVPKGREGLFGKGLFAGYERDFVTALHILVPQIEHMVRWHLKTAGIKTTNLDQDGIENENGLSTLMDLSEVTEIFGKNLAFEIRALFCDAFGPNLRNELAHGLLDEGACQSVYAIYAWWLCLRLVFNTFWNKARREEGATPDPNFGKAAA